MALKTKDDDAETGQGASDKRAETTAADEAALRELKASATALALIEAFARVTAHHIVADARAARRGRDDNISHGSDKNARCR